MSEVRSTICERGDGQMIVTTGPKTCCFGSKRTAAEFIAMYQEELLSAAARIVAWEDSSQRGHPTPCNMGPLCPYCEIDRLTARLAEAEGLLVRLVKCWGPHDVAHYTAVAEHNETEHHREMLRILEAAKGGECDE